MGGGGLGGSAPAACVGAAPDPRRGVLLKEVAYYLARASAALMRWNVKDGLTEHRKPADHPNGHTLDRDGNVIGCQQRPREMG